MRKRLSKKTLLLSSLVMLSCLQSTLCMAASWTREDDGKFYIPAFQKLKNSEVGAFKVRIIDDLPYATTGMFFKAGSIFQNNQVIAKTQNNQTIPIQLDTQNTHPDGSIRFALVTVKISGQSDDVVDVMLHKTNQTQLEQNIKPLTPNIQVTVAKGNNFKKSVSLLNASPERQPWRSGHLIDVRRYFAPISPDLMVVFDVSSYENGKVKTDIVMHYDRIYETPMQNATYQMRIDVNNKLYQNFKQVMQNHHSKFRIPIRFGYNKENTTVLDTMSLMDNRVLPRYDVTLGVDKETVYQDGEKLSQADLSLQGSGLITHAMPDTGTRDEIALFPQWATRYLLTGHDISRDVVLAHGEIASYIPWHFIDNNTQLPPVPRDHPRLWIEPRATLDVNGITPYVTDQTKWYPDISHQPSLSFLPYIITGDRYFYDNLADTFVWSRFALINHDGLLRDKNLRTQNFDQQRAYGWLQRLTTETALVTPNNTPLYQWLAQQMPADAQFFQQAQIEGAVYENGRYGNPTGETYGMLHGWGGDTDKENSVFMQNLAAIAIGHQAMSGVNNQMFGISSFQTNFLSGIFLQKHNGFPPEYAPAYKIMQFIPDDQKGIDTPTGKIRILNRWRDIFAYSINSGYFNEATKDVQQGRLPNYQDSATMFVAYSRAAQAQLFNTTRDTRALEAWGFLAQYIPFAIEDYERNPAFLIVPEIDSGFLSLKRTIIGNQDNDTITAQNSFNTIHGHNGNDTLSLGKFGGVLFGGNGNDRLYGGRNKSYLFGGDGEDRLVSGISSDIMKGDENFGNQKDIFKFDNLNFGTDKILDFTPTIDKIQFTSSTGLKTFIHDNKIHGMRKDGKISKYGNNTSDERREVFLKTVQPELAPNLTNQQKKQEVYELLSLSARGDAEAKRKLNIVAVSNQGVDNYIKGDGMGGTIIDLNINRTPDDELSLVAKSQGGSRFGVIHLPNVSPEKLNREDFIFSDE